MRVWDSALFPELVQHFGFRAEDVFDLTVLVNFEVFGFGARISALNPKPGFGARISGSGLRTSG